MLWRSRKRRRLLPQTRQPLLHPLQQHHLQSAPIWRTRCTYRSTVVNSCRSSAHEDGAREDGNRDDGLSDFDEELLQRVQAQLERIDFAKKAPDAPDAKANAASAAAQDAASVPEGVTFEGLRTMRIIRHRSHSS